MQMQIGAFRFEAGGPEYQELYRVRARRWETRARHGKPPEVEDMGRDAERIELTGTVWVSTSDELAALDELVSEAGLVRDGEGKPLPVFLGGGSGSSGDYLGEWAVTRLEVTEGSLRHDGVPTEIEFNVTLLEAADT